MALSSTVEIEQNYDAVHFATSESEPFPASFFPIRTCGFEPLGRFLSGE